MIVLVNPPNPPGRVSNKEMMGGFGQCYPPECDVKVPPIDLPYVAAVLRDRKIEVRVIECLGEELTLEGLIAELKKDNFKMVCIRTSTSTFSWDTKVSSRIKEEIDTTVLFFGPHVTIMPDNVIDHPSIDAIVLGEPEYTIGEIAATEFGDTLGVWYKAKGKVIKNNPRGPITNLDDLPFPAWDLLPYLEYTIGDLMSDEHPTLFLQTSRGCPFNCNYCPYPVAQGSTFRKRSPKNVLDEISWLVERFGVKNILIRDAEFTLDKKRVEEICKGLINSHYGISWRCETRVDTLDEPLLEVMHNAGCIGINMGIETRSKKICEKSGRKPLRESDTNKIIKKCQQLGIRTFCFFIIGLPGDDRSTVLDTIDYATALGTDDAQFTVATPYLGTPLHDWAAKNNYIESLEHDKITGFEKMMRNENLDSDQMILFRDGAQTTVDSIKSRKLAGKKEKLDEDRSFISSLMSHYYSIYHFKGIREVVVYGTKGISISRIKKAGFKVLAVVDGEERGASIDGMTVLSPEIIKPIKPEAVLVSPYKSAVYLENFIHQNTVVVEPFTKLKKFLKGKTALINILKKVLVHS